jgi:hypothetical protein
VTDDGGAEDDDSIEMEVEAPFNPSFPMKLGRYVLMEWIIMRMD